MYFLYNITIILTNALLKIIAIFNKKIALFIRGRRDIYKKLSDNFSKNDAVLWFHCASLGEFEQGRPIIERARSQFPKHKILITFFSPSGYEIRKNFEGADLVIYLPFDTKKNVKQFLQIIRPELAVFVKYEFWPNLLRELKELKINTILVSGIFRKDQIFFKWYGQWMKKSLESFNHFFVQNEQSKKLLGDLGFSNVTVSGDTRFDRVFKITEQDNKNDHIEKFVNNKVTLICGSTWPKDEELLVNYINNKSTIDQKFIIAPHNIKDDDIRKLKQSILTRVVLFSEMKNKNLKDYNVLIIDTIGLLSKIYYYADIAYVGGGFGSGIHNILEPVTFANPVIIGPIHQKFNEANDLIDLGACEVIDNQKALNEILLKLFADEKIRKQKGVIAFDYIKSNVGATDIIEQYIGDCISKNQ
jgi:3-deoxy-D-manno-octulosonic-acid transferase